MKPISRHKKLVSLLLALALVPISLAACSPLEAESKVPPQEQTMEPGPDTSRYIVSIEDEPDTVDFQCTTIHYTVATNVFDRLVEMETNADGSVVIVPSLAESWEISEDRRGYTFHLRKGVTFSNGSPLTASDVEYTLTRLVTHPDSCNRDIADEIEGAGRLARGEADRLEGFELLGELDFTITLEQPFEAFLACLSMPGASILDEETTRAAGDRFGTDPAWTVSTGPFVLSRWESSKGMTFTANPLWRDGAPRCEGVDLLFLKESEDERKMFENGELDILDLDELGSSAEYFIHGDIYQDRLFQVRRIAITYIALNESVEPLNDARVRKALQLGLNREALLDAVYSGRGDVENGIYPRGLYGYNPELPDIPWDPEAARELLRQAGYPDGFDLEVSVKSSSTRWELVLMTLAASMWEKIGVRASINVLDEDEFMRLRKSGKLACYTAMWTADYNDPDNFIYTFFGSDENTAFRSLCYPREDIMERVRGARTITDADARLREYRALEEIIIQQDAAWIPLFSRLHSYVTSERLEGMRVSWNGSVKNNYRYMSVKEAQ